MPELPELHHACATQALPVKPCRRPGAPRRNLSTLCLDMEEPLNEALDAAHAIRLIGHALREVGNERDARAIA